MASPKESIRKHCIDCTGGEYQVKGCMGDALIDGPCLFYKYREGSGRPSVKMIRKYCVNHCMNRRSELVKLCKSSECYLHPFRMGKNPNRSGIGGNVKAFGSVAESGFQGRV